MKMSAAATLNGRARENHHVEVTRELRKPFLPRNGEVCRIAVEDSIPDRNYRILGEQARVRMISIPKREAGNR